MRLVLALALCTLAATAADFDVVVRNVARRTVRKLVVLARDADAAGLPATARDLRLRILELDENHVESRRSLGFRRVKGGWAQGAQEKAEMAARADADAELTKQYARDGGLIEEEHLQELIRVCVTYGTPAQKRRVLLPYLARMPRRADLHEALGHRKIGDDWVRPRLQPLVEAMDGRLAAWRACAELPGDVRLGPIALGIPGLDPKPVLWHAGGRDVGCTLAEEHRPGVARTVERTQALLRLLLGDEPRPWDPSPVLFLDAESYGKLVAALHPDPEERRLYGGYGNYEHRDFYAIRVWQPKDAAERYAHAAGHMSMYLRAAPDVPGEAGVRDTRAYAWLLEGFGYLMSLELVGSDHVGYVSLEESAGKRPTTRPPPAPKERKACLAWMAEQVLAGHGHTLPELCSLSLNNLDFLASMEAYSFVRFLFLMDPEAARLLPEALRKRATGPQADRTDAALQEVFGRGFGDLDPLWRAFILEITPR